MPRNTQGMVHIAWVVLINKGREGEREREEEREEGREGEGGREGGREREGGILVLYNWTLVTNHMPKKIKQTNNNKLISHC